MSLFSVIMVYGMSGITSCEGFTRLGYCFGLFRWANFN